MRVLTINKTQLIITILILLLMIALLLDPNTYMQATLHGISIWFNNVVPALFPFFFLTKLLTSLNVLHHFSSILNTPMSRIFHCPGVSGFVYIMSIISGYPVGAKLNSELYLNRTISREELVRINAFTSTSGPLFVIGSVGVGMFYSHTAGVIILLSHLIGALLNGLVYRNYHYNRHNRVCSHSISNHTPSMDKLLSDSVYNSIISILVVGAYIALCSVLIEVLVNFHILDILSYPLVFLLNLFGVDPHLSTGILTGMVEMTRGCIDLAPKFQHNTTLVTILATALISFGGISINLQAITFLSKCDISIPFYFFQKFTQTILSVAVCIVLLLLFPI